MLITTAEMIALMRAHHRVLVRLWPTSEGTTAPDWEQWSAECLAETAGLRGGRHIRRSGLEVDVVPEAPAPPAPGLLPDAP